MPEATLFMLLLVIVAALLFDYINGFHDTANAIATCVSTRALSIKAAIIMAAVLNFAGAMISTKVAATIGKGIVDPVNVTQMVVLAGIIGAIIWNLITWYYGLPSSSSHAIIGGIMGAVIAHAGSSALHWAGLKKIILALSDFTDPRYCLRLYFHGGDDVVFQEQLSLWAEQGFPDYRFFPPPSWPFPTGPRMPRSPWGLSPWHWSATAISTLSTCRLGQDLLRHGHGPRHRRRRLAHHQDSGE